MYVSVCACVHEDVINHQAHTVHTHACSSTPTPHMREYCTCTHARTMTGLRNRTHTHTAKHDHSEGRKSESLLKQIVFTFIYFFLQKLELDKASKDTNHKKFDKDFSVKLEFRRDDRKRDVFDDGDEDLEGGKIMNCSVLGMNQFALRQMHRR